MKPDNGIVSIDQLALDKECVRLPTDILQYAHRVADARLDLSELKAEMDVVEADLAKKIRRDPENYGIDKVTESAINKEVLLQKEYRDAQDSVRKKQYDLDVLQAAVTALEAKKRTLTLLVDLHGMGYFAAPRISEKGREAVKEMTQKKTRRAWADD